MNFLQTTIKILSVFMTIVATTTQLNAAAGRPVEALHPIEQVDEPAPENIHDTAAWLKEIAQNPRESIPYDELDKTLERRAVRAIFDNIIKQERERYKAKLNKYEMISNRWLPSSDDNVSLPGLLQMTKKNIEDFDMYDLTKEQKIQKVIELEHAIEALESDANYYKSYESWCNNFDQKLDKKITKQRLKEWINWDNQLSPDNTKLQKVEPNPLWNIPYNQLYKNLTKTDLREEIKKNALEENAQYRAKLNQLEKELNIVSAQWWPSTTKISLLKRNIERMQEKIADSDMYNWTKEKKNRELALLTDKIEQLEKNYSNAPNKEQKNSISDKTMRLKEQQHLLIDLIDLDEWLKVDKE